MASNLFSNKADIFLATAAFMRGTDYLPTEEYDELFRGDMGLSIAKFAAFELFGDVLVEASQLGLPEGSSPAKVTTEVLMKHVPTSAQLIEQYGTWNDAHIAADLKSFNGFLFAYTFSRNTKPELNDDEDKISDWPEWIEPVGDIVVSLYQQGNLNTGLLSTEAKTHLRGAIGYQPDGVVAARELALHFSDLANALINGEQPNQMVVGQYKKYIEYFTGSSAVSNEQLIVLAEARKYLTK